MAGCGNAPAAPTTAPATTYTIQNKDGSVTAIIDFDGGFDWTCSTTPAIEGVPCAQMVGSQLHFFYGHEKIGVEELVNGRTTGRLELEPDWKIVSEVTH